MIERAPAYPFEPSAGGVWPMAEEDELCEQEIQQAVLTYIGELPVEKGVGSRFARLLFALDSEIQDTAAKRFAQDAVDAMIGNVVILAATIVEDGEGTTTVTLAFQRTPRGTPKTIGFEVTQ